MVKSHSIGQKAVLYMLANKSVAEVQADQPNSYVSIIVVDSSGIETDYAKSLDAAKGLESYR